MDFRIVEKFSVNVIDRVEVEEMEIVVVDRGTMGGLEKAQDDYLFMKELDSSPGG